MRTNSQREAIENNTQQKGNIDDAELMLSSFKEYYRVLKPGAWMTVEFSNTNASIWNAIQYTLQKAGFVVSNVSALDKVHGGIKSMRYTTSVKEDLVITCYKPNSELENTLVQKSINISIWEFVEEHLRHLPVQIVKKKKSTAIIERNPKILI